MFCGTSFVGNGMSAIFYPFNLLFVVMPVETAFGWVAWLHLVLAGIFMFGFLRQFFSPLSALTGAIAFQLCGFFVAWLAYLPLLCTATWLPAALWAYEFGSRSHPNACTPTRLHAYTLASLSLGMSLLAGHPQVGFYVLWAFGVYVLLKTFVARTFQPLLWGMLSLVGGVIFGAVQLLPLLEMASISFRRVQKVRHWQQPIVCPLTNSFVYSCHPFSAIGAAAPTLFGISHASTLWSGRVIQVSPPFCWRS
jgi:hypothetical protein